MFKLFKVKELNLKWGPYIELGRVSRFRQRGLEVFPEARGHGSEIYQES